MWISWTRAEPAAFWRVGWRYCLRWPTGASSFSTTQATSVTRDMVWSYHLWFLSLLFLFCLALAAARRVAGSGLARPARAGGPSRGRFGLLALGVGLAAGVGQLCWPDGAWGRLGPSRLSSWRAFPSMPGFSCSGSLPGDTAGLWPMASRAAPGTGGWGCCLFCVHGGQPDCNLGGLSRR